MTIEQKAKVWDAIKKGTLSLAQDPHTNEADKQKALALLGMFLAIELEVEEGEA